MVAEIAREVRLMEQRAMAEADEHPQKLVSELFAACHKLLTIKPMVEQVRPRRPTVNPRASGRCNEAPGQPGEGGRVPRYVSRGTTGGASVRSKAAENR
jgi:hypothetical protein